MSAPSPIPRTIPFRTLDRVSGAVWGLVAVLVLVGALSVFLGAGEPHGRGWRAAPSRPLGGVSGAWWGPGAVRGLVGALSVFLGAGEPHGRVWQALLFNWLFWSSVAIGMFMLAVAWQVVGAGWPWALRRSGRG